MKTYLLLLSLAALLVSSEALAQDALRWNLEKGAKFNLQMKQQTDSIVALSSKKLDSTVDLQVGIGWEVTAADKEQFVIEQTIETIRIEMKGADQTPVIYDSRDKKALVGTAKELAGSVAGLIGVKFKLTMNAQGIVSASERLTPETAEAPTAGDAAKAMASSKETVAQLLSRPLLPLPKESEQTWTDERKTKAALGEVKLTRTFTLESTENKPADQAATKKIKIDGTLEVTPNPEIKAGAKLTSQSHAGSAVFDNRAGRLVSLETKQRLVTESMYRDSTINVDLTTTLTTTLSPRE